MLFIGSKPDSKLFTCAFRLYIQSQVNGSATYRRDAYPVISESNSAVNVLIRSVFFDLAHRPLMKPAVFHAQLARNSHLTEYPEIFHIMKVAHHRILHPADHHASSVRSLHDLRRIEIQTAIDRLVYIVTGVGIIRIRSKIFAFLIVFSCNIADIVALRESDRTNSFLFFSLHIHGACYKYMLVSKRKKVRTLPHNAYPAFIFKEHLAASPIKAVIAAVHSQLCAGLLISPAVCYQYSECTVLSSPQIRISEFICISAFRQILFFDDRVFPVFYILITAGAFNSDILRLDPSAFACRIS